jgi:hypothetical protein
MAAGLASEDAARKALKDYTGVTALDAQHDPSKLESAAQILIEIVLGARKPVRGNRRTKRPDDETTRRRDDETTRRRE